MKLKKVVSLALAGVMAVSMLAGCATKPGTDSGEGEGATTGYSAEFAKYVNESITELDNLTFADNATDAEALKSAAGYYTNFNIFASNFAKFAWIELNDTSKDFMDKAGVTDKGADYYGIPSGAFANCVNTRMNETVKYATMFIADASMDLDKALELAAKDFSKKFVGDVEHTLPEQGSASGSTYDYSYVVSVSVVNRAMSSEVIATNGSVNIIAVTITRTGTPHQV